MILCDMFSVSVQRSFRLILSRKKIREIRFLIMPFAIHLKPEALQAVQTYFDYAPACVHLKGDRLFTPALTKI